MGTTPQPQPTADPVKVDPKHYTVEFENDRVRVLRIRYGPGEKSAMHWHPDGLAVALNDQHSRFTFPDGKTEDIHLKAGEIKWVAGGDHLPENVSKTPFECILVELKR